MSSKCASEIFQLLREAIRIEKDAEFKGRIDKRFPSSQQCFFNLTKFLALSSDGWKFLGILRSKYRQDLTALELNQITFVTQKSAREIRAYYSPYNSKGAKSNGSIIPSSICLDSLYTTHWPPNAPSEPVITVPFHTTSITDSHRSSIACPMV